MIYRKRQFKNNTLIKNYNEIKKQSKLDLRCVILMLSVPYRA